jgi:hypothetical protein
LNVIRPDEFEYYFVDEEFVADREFGLTSNQYILAREIPNCLRFVKKMLVLGKSSVETKSKVFNVVLLRDLHFIYMDWWARCASSSERHMDRLTFSLG